MRCAWLLVNVLALTQVVASYLVQGKAGTMRVLRHILDHSGHRSIHIRHHSRRSLSALPSSQQGHLSRARNAFGKEVLEAEFQGVTSNERKRRSITNAVIESAHCEHISLMDCSEYDSDDMTCALTATGMTCCVCTGTINRIKEWSFF